MPLASLLKQYSFESDTTRLLTTAFDQTWAKVVASHSPLANEENADAARLLLAKWMIARTQGGERDPDRLFEGATKFMAELKLQLPRS
jgi:hypothetical protein